MYLLSKVMKDPDCTLWRGVALDFEAKFKVMEGKTMVFWGYTSTTKSMNALDAFIPLNTPQVFVEFVLW